MSIKNDCPCTCNSDQICDVCSPHPTFEEINPDPEIVWFEQLEKRLGKDHPTVMHAAGALGLLSLCIIIMPLLTSLEVA